MKVTLVDWKRWNTILPAVQICQNTQNPVRALEQALKDGHLSLLEHLDYTFHITGISRACSHQLVRHRIASYSQQSQRFVKIKEDNWYVTPESVAPYKEYFEAMDITRDTYFKLLDKNVPLEDARYVLPNATTTELITTFNARSLDNLFKLRMCKNTQWEFREVVKAMYKLVCPINDYFKSMKYPDCKNCPKRDRCK